MSMLKRRVATILGSLTLVVLPAHGQGTFPGIGDDMTSSLGSFKIQVANQFASLFNGCPGYDVPSRIFTSPTLYDPATIIGRSNVTLDDSPFRKGSVAAGSTRTVVPEDTLLQPPGYPCFGDSVTCASGPGTRVVHTEIHSLMMTALPPAPPVTVRAGTHYDDSPYQTDPPFRASVGLVQSKSGPSNNPTKDFPASSFFDVYAKVDFPACGGFPGGTTITLYNSMPLTVTNNQLIQFPPKVVYLHDASTIVPILFEFDGPPSGPGQLLWHKNDKLGCFVLAGHGVGFSSSSDDTTNFTNYMAGQANSPCPM
jgi:hypothetical protein